MTKQSILSLLIRSSQTLSTGLTLAAIVVSQYKPPSDPPPRRQSSFTDSAQEASRVPLSHFLFES
ncbi:MAG: hypothetical protein KME27_15350 [Lyngbya sp. HA4199-MV5]|nr:hypothetical protein [Lyngbya sp. HA4199-MV5]